MLYLQKLQNYIDDRSNLIMVGVDELAFQQVLQSLFISSESGQDMIDMGWEFGNIISYKGVQLVLYV